MGRTARDKTEQRPKPVKKIELSDKNVKLRIIAAALFLLLGAALITYSVNNFLSPELGWTAVETYAANDVDCSEEFVFLYNLKSAGEEKAVRTLYSDAALKAYRLFNESESFDGITNVRDINQNPNKELSVDKVLYDAFSLISELDSRYIYLAPVYARYDDIFYCADDSGLVDFDPRLNDEVKAEYAEVWEYAQNGCRVELLGDNKIKLSVSDSYLEYAEKEGITDFVSFFWLKNAFITDYIADIMIENGFTDGSITSYDGYTRNLGVKEDYSLNIFDRRGDKVYAAAVMRYTGALSAVSYRDFPLNSLDSRRFYTLNNGEIRHSYLDFDGFCKSALGSLLCMSADKSCAEISLSTAPFYISDEFDGKGLSELSESGIFSVYCENGFIRCSSPSVTFTDLYDDGTVRYEVKE